MKKIEKHFLDHPAVRHHFEEIFPIIVNESDRGAVLIAASQVDNFLEAALKQIAPKELSKKKLKNIFDYSGALGTFSSRLNMAYFFRIIDKEVFQAIGVLRGLRNDVAHNLEYFTLLNNQEKISNIYNIGSGVSGSLHNWAMEEIMHEVINKSLELKKPDSADKEYIFTEAKEVVEYISNKPEIIKNMEDKLPKWKLGLGTALMCGIIFYGSDNASMVLGDNLTFSKIKAKE